MADLIESLFADLTEVEEIPVREDEIYRQHYMSLYERINACKTATSTAAEDEVLKSNIAAKKILFVTAEVAEPEANFFYDMADVKMIEDFEIEGALYRCAIPTTAKIPAWKEGLQAYYEHVTSKLQDLSHYDKKIQAEMERCLALIGEVEFSRQQKQQQQVHQVRLLMLKCLILEQVLKAKLKEFAEQCTQVKIVPDPITDGLWAHLKERSSQIQKSTLVIPIARRFRLDSKSVSLIVEMMFSKLPILKAQAKLDLAARLSDETHALLKSEPEKLLASAIAEANLAPAEVLAVVFPIRKEGEHHCKSCLTVVNIAPVIYHPPCMVIEWITKYQPFMYSETDRALVPIRRAYIDPVSRYRISQLLNLHDQLNNDIVVKDARGTTIWKRKANGVLEKQTVSTRKEEDIIGTAAWKRKYGYSPSR